MKQPAAGLAATLFIVAVSLGFISLFSFPMFSGWVAYLIDCTIPMQIVIVFTWRAKQPALAATQPHPTKGLLLLLLNFVVGAVCAVVLWTTIGHSFNPPTPILIFYMIDFVLTTFWMTIMLGGWPFTTMFKNPVAAGFALLVADALVSYIIFRVFFDFSFMHGAPFYRAGLDPQGMFNAWSALVFYVTLIAVMFITLAFDRWPFTKFPAIMRQPVLGVVWTLADVVIALAAFYIGTALFKMDVVVFMVTVPIPLVFGSIIVLNMIQHSLFANLKQPLKGVANFALIAIITSAVAERCVAVGSSGL